MYDAQLPYNKVIVHSSGKPLNCSFEH